MSLTFTTVDQLIDFLPCEPAFSPESPQWVQVGRLAGMLDLTDTGLGKVRKRFRNEYEHRHKGGTYIFAPNWLRLYMFDQANQQE